MEFQDALRALKSGRRIGREHVTWTWRALVMNEEHTILEDQAGVDSSAWLPKQIDILANDWRVL